VVVEAGRRSGALHTAGVARLLDDPARPPHWGAPFARHGETLPHALSGVAESVLATTVRRPDQAISLISHTVSAAARGNSPSSRRCSQ